MKVSDVKDMPPERWRPGVETRMVISALNGATQLCIFEQWIAPGVGAPTHSHPVEEVLTVRAGEAEMWIDEQRVIVSSGQSL
ncbi:MAG TPA: cupin domain-containing protein, partial [Bradyrhizobium sp.]|nr:cupin domain-containing protein [Bradyrhizobium sp.]